MSTRASLTARDLFDPTGQAQSQDSFLEANPSFADTAILDELRTSEYGRLDASGDVYLDYTGGSLYAASQLEEHLRLLRETVYGNPHSVNPTSSAATVLVERARPAVLRYFNAPESELRLHLHPQRHGRPTARRRGVSIRAAGSVSGDVRQSQLRQRDPRVRPGEGSAAVVRASRGARSARGPTACSSVISTRAPRTATTSSPTRRSPTSPASSTRSSGSRWPRSGAGT